MKTVHWLSVSLVLLSLASCRTQSSADLPVNVVLIFIDDEGYGDVGCFGATGFKTPNLDQMAGEGMRFTNFYSGSAVCTPSRAALLTGCYPPRVGLTKVLFPYDSIGLNREETTIAELLKKKKFATAIIGKWHLGHHREFLPLQHGFDEYVGLPYSNDMWPVHYNGLPVTEENCLRQWKLECPPLPLMEGNDKIREIRTLEDQDMLTSVYTEHAVDFIRRNRENPFFLYLPHTMAHVPLGVSDRFKGLSRQGMYGDVMMEIDWSVGEIIQILKSCGIDKNTLVIFTTDNGPWLNYGNHGGSAGGLKEGKGSVFEGGFRVPCIMRWPDVIPPGTVCNQIASSIDILPTIADIAGTGMPDKRIDGLSLLSLMSGNAEEVIRDEFFFYAGKSLRAVRKGNWKLVFPHTYNSNEGSVVGMDGWPGTMVRKDYEGGLYDLIRDPGERYDMSLEHPVIVKELEEFAARMREELGDAGTGTRGSQNRPPGRKDMN